MVKVVKKTFFVLSILIASLFCAISFSSKHTLNVAPSINNVDAVTEADSPQVDVEADFTKGEVSGGGRYAVGDTVELIANAKDGCYFVKWQIKVGEVFEDLMLDGSLVTSTTYTFVMNGDVTFFAVFDFLPYAISSNFDNYFTLTNFEYVYDNSRFDASNLPNYVRADKDSAFVDGKVYYNDVVTMKFQNKEDMYVKQLSINNFSFDTKPCAIINITPDGILTSTEINRIITNYEGQNKSLSTATTDGTIVFDYDNYTYLILAQKKVSENYTTTNVELKYKVTQNATFNVNARELYVFTIKAWDESNNSIKISQVESLITFDYGYYGLLNRTEDMQQYLIENGANYSLSFASNKFYVYLGGQLGIQFTDNNKRGYFSKNITQLNVYFQRLKYEVTFEEYVRIGTRVVAMTNPWYNLKTQEVYPGKTITLDIENKTIDNDGQTTTFEPQNVYGYKLFALGGTKDINIETLSPYSITIDETNPTNKVVYIIHQPINYNLHVAVVDKNGVENEYLKSKISYITTNKTVTSGDTVALTGVANTGFDVLGWKSLDSQLTDSNRADLLAKEYLATLNFKFAPTSNVDTNLYYYLFADYEYKTLKYSLDSASFDAGNPMASIGLGIIDYFTLGDDNTFTVYGKSVVGNTLSSTELITKVLATGVEVDKGANKIYQYKTPIGDIQVLKTKGEGEVYNSVSLTFASHVYMFDGTKFAKNTTVPVDYSVNYVHDGTNYSQEINTTCDDVVLCLSTNRNSTDYKFSYYTIDKKTTLSSFSLDGASSLGDYAYVYSSNKNVELYCVFSLKTQNISVKIDGKGYSIEDVVATINDKTDNVVLDANGTIVLSAENGNSIKIVVDTTKVAPGYQYDKIETTYAKLHPEGINVPQTIQSGDNYVMQFFMTSEYANLDIFICFVETNYTVKIVDESLKGLNARYSADATITAQPIEDGQFVINWTIFGNLPYMLISSADGYYIVNAYINVDDADHSLNEYLQGTEHEQTIDKKFVFDDFEKYILANADSNNVITIYISQAERMYFVRVTYQLNEKSNAQNTQYATIKYSLTGESKKPSLTGTEYQLMFDKISFGTSNIKLTMDASNVSGIQFSSWCKYGDGKTLTVISNSLDLLIDSPIGENLEYVALFTCIEYTVDFKFVYQSSEVNGKPRYTEYDLAEYINIGQVNVDKTKFTVGDKIKFDIVAKPGYQYHDLYYGYLIDGEALRNGVLRYVYTETSGIATNKDENVKNGYIVDASTNAPYNGFNNILTFQYPWSTKELQINNESYRKLVIYLIFQEKLYGLNVKTENSSGENTTGVDVEKWLDTDSLSIKYKTVGGAEYIENTDENPKYRTNTLLEIKFKASFLGIKLDQIYLANEGFVLSYVDKVPEHELAGQTVMLFMEDGLYVLRFQLNTTLLEKVEDEVAIGLKYEIRQYNVEFSARSANGLLKEEFGIKISYDYDMGGQVGENKEGFVFLGGYGYNLSCTVNLEDAKGQNFDKKYYFAYFLVNGEKLLIHSSDADPENSYSINFKSEFGSDKLNIWQMNALQSKISVIAMFAPKITLNNFEKDGLKYTRTVTYNSYAQMLTTAYDKNKNHEDESTADIVYDVSEFGQIGIQYTNTKAQNTDPINADTYTVYLTIQGYTFEGEIYLIIQRAKVSLEYKGNNVSKVYDGTTNITNDNKEYLASTFNLVGVKDNDLSLSKFDFSQVSGEYDSKAVGNNKLLKINGIGLSSALKQNYEFDTKISDIDYYLTNTQLVGKGVITPKTVTVDRTLFKFEDIVYKENQDYKLKYSVDYDKTIDGEKVIQSGRILVSGKIAGDEVYINFDGNESNIAFVLDDYSVGKNKKVTLNIDTSLSGADSVNYIIQDVVYYIDIYPYMLTYKKENVGEFAIVDKDEKCLIPIELYGYDSFVVDYVDSTNPDYPNYYTIMEGNLARDERLQAFYVIHVYSQYGADVGIVALSGCYFRMPSVKNEKNIYTLDGDSFKTIGYSGNDSYFEIKLNNDIKPTLCLVIDKTYFSIWRIVIIVGAILLLVLLIIFIILIIKRKKQKENESKDKI